MTNDTESMRLEFRNAMANLAAAVNVVTTDGEAGKCGITATAVMSITDTPPTVLVAVNKKSEMNSAFQGNGKMCVNVLSDSQEEVAAHFAGMKGSTMEERFADPSWESGKLGLPVNTGAISSLEGEICKTDELGTHNLYFVELKNIVVREKDALMYFARKFKTLSLE